MDLFLCQLRLNPKYHDLANWDAPAQAAFKGHAEFLNQHVQTGKVVFVGRSDTDLKDNLGVCIFKAESLEEAKKFSAQDPVVQKQVMSFQVHPFKLLVASDELKKWNVW